MIRTCCVAQGGSSFEEKMTKCHEDYIINMDSVENVYVRGLYVFKSILIYLIFISDIYMLISIFCTKFQNINVNRGCLYGSYILI